MTRIEEIRLENRVLKAADALNTEDRYLIANALRLAAEQYDADGVANDQVSARLSNHFENMAWRCRVIAEALEP